MKVKGSGISTPNSHHNLQSGRCSERYPSVWRTLARVGARRGVPERIGPRAVAPPRTVFNSDSKATSSTAPPRVDRSRSAAPKVATASTAAASAATAGSTWRPSLDRGQSAAVLTPRSRPESPSLRQPDRSLSLPSQSKPQPLARALRRSLPLSPFPIVRVVSR